MATIGELNILIAANIDQFEAAMNQAERGIGRLGQGLKTAGAGLSAAITLPLGLLGGAALAASGQIDALRRGLQAVTQQQLSEQGVTGVKGIAQAAVDTKARLLELRQVAALPGLGFAEAIQGDIRLRAVGISADLSKRALLAFGNAIATTGGGKGELDRVTVQLGQLSAKGKVLAQDLRPIIEAAPAVATALKKLYGTVDSETISKSLEQQGKSSTEFIDTLTTELAKLPAVTGGLKNSLENFKDSTQISLAAFGDAINKAFDIEGKLGQLGDFITELAEKFSALEPATQKTIFVVAGLAAAVGPLLLGLGAVAAALPAIAAGFAVLTGPIGLAVAAAALLVVGITAVASSGTDLGRAFDDQKSKVSNLEQSINPLLKRYDELKGKASLNTTEQAELKKIIGEVSTAIPGAATAFDSYGNALDINSGKARAFVLEQQAVLRALNAEKISEQNAKLRELATQIIATTEELRSGTKTYLDEDGYPTVTKQTGEDISSLQASLKSLNQQFNDGNALLRSYKGEVIDTGTAATKAGSGVSGLAGDIKASAKEAEDALKALQKLNEGYGNIGARRIIKPQETPEFKLNVPELPDLPTALPTLDIAGFTGPLQEATAQMALFQVTAETFSAGVAQVLEQALESTASAVGEAIGQIALGSGGLELVGAALLAGVGSLAIQLGQLAIGAGIAIAGIKQALQSLNPAVAIAGGIALVALGTFVKGKAASIGGGGGGGSISAGGGGGPAPTRFTPSVAPAAATQAGPTTVIHKVEITASGRDLANSLTIETDRLGRVTGRGR